MQQALRLFIAAVAAAGLVYLAGSASAQGPMKQIKLSEKQIEGFIAAHEEMMKELDKGSDGKSEAEAQAQLDAIVRKFGFKDHDEYDLVATNIAMVMVGIDPQTKEFTDPPTLAKRELDEAIADKTLPEKERKQLVEELTEQLKAVQPIMHPSNIDLVKKHFDRIEPLLQ